MVNMMAQNSSPYLTPFVSYICFRKRLKFIFSAYCKKMIFLLLLLCRAVTSKAFRM